MNQMRLLKAFPFAVLCAVLFAQASAQPVVRKKIPLNEGWQFSFVNDVYRESVNKVVSLPHSWNADEVMNDKTRYQRTNGVYRKRLRIDPSWADKRLFLYFEGAGSVADVFVNKRFVGEHKGGYTAFCFEITRFIHPGRDNDINVMVSNTYRLDVLPMAGDFNVYGGLHRPVSLIVTEKDCITPLDHGASGVYITARNVTDGSADIGVHVKLSLATPGVSLATPGDGGPHRGLQLRTLILDAQSKIVAEGKVAAPAGDTDVRVQHLLARPHLWNGKSDPYLYRLKVELWDGDRLVDTVVEPFGVRYFHVDPDKGFFLNGHYLDLHGLCFHEDVAGRASAYIPADYGADMALMNEIGLTALRFSHYPHGQPMYALTDQNGIVVWAEIPFIGSGGLVGEGYANSDAFHAHARNLLTEMIRQNYNHPSIFFWGLFNELTANFDDPTPFLKELNALAHEEDPTRLTTCADMLEYRPFDSVSDIKAWNKYFGWYGGKVSEIGPFLDRQHQRLPQKPIAISEYGAGASVYQHCGDSLLQPQPGGMFHPEEWQSWLHEQYWEQLNARPWLWAKFAWVLADFGSAGRHEGDTIGINDKGLVTYDRKTKKDAFYFYKANWNVREPTLYIVGRRNNVRRRALTRVEVYCNLPAAELWVNGRNLGRKKPDPLKRIIWENVTLEKGMNTIEARATAGERVRADGRTTDRCTWELR
jgi:beta-galactosidase